MIPQNKSHPTLLERIANWFTNWVGSTSSLIVHTVVFLLSFLLVFFGVGIDKVLLVLTTAVSLEAIYLAIFIQMTVNRNTQSLEEVEENIDEIQEDVEGIEKDIDEIQEDVEGMEKDIDEIQEDVDKLEEDEQQDDLHDEATMKTLDKLQGDMQRLMNDIQALKDQKKL